MIVGIGTDLVHIPRIQSLLDKHGDKIAERILSEQELAEFTMQLKPAAFLAKRFAAKEAAAKALGTGFRDGLSLKHIIVKNDKLGKPELHFTQVGQHLRQEKNVGASFLSLSDEQDYAMAYVVLMEAKA